MSSFRSLMLICITLLYIGKGYAQNDKKEAVQTITKFYTAYSSVKRTAKNIPKLDALQKSFLTKAYQAEIKKEMAANGLDHDLLTADKGIDNDALKTLTVNSTLKTNVYSVVYIIDTTSPANQPVKQKVNLKVRVAKESGAFKIESVD